MKNDLLKISFQVLRFVLPVVLISWLATQVDWQAVMPLLREMNWWIIPLSAACYLVAHIIFTIRWRYLLRVKSINLPFFRLLGYILISIFVSNFLPTTIGGDLVKMAGVARDVKERRGIAAASVVADRLYNLAGMVVLLLPSLAIMAPPLGLMMKTGRGSGSLAMAALMPWRKKAMEKLVQGWNSTREWFTSPTCVLYSLGLSIMSVGLNFAAFWLVLKGLGIEASFWQAMAIATLAYFIALVPVAINGLGVQEGSITFMLTQLGASAEQAVAAAFLIRLVTLSVSLLGGIWLLVDGKGLLSLARETSVDHPAGEQKP